MASALRIAIANKAGEYSGQLAKDLQIGRHFMHECVTVEMRQTSACKLPGLMSNYLQ